MRRFRKNRAESGLISLRDEPILKVSDPELVPSFLRLATEQSRLPVSGRAQGDADALSSHWKQLARLGRLLGSAQNNSTGIRPVEP